MIIFLYIKTHNKTGLKYFGKTTQDPHNYRGSGVYWLRHLAIHGDDVTTEVYGEYSDVESCALAATQFSILNDIVESFEWANLIIEDGKTGGAIKFGPLSEDTKEKIRLKSLGRKLSEDTKEKIRAKRLIQDMTHMKRPKTEDHKRKISDSLKGRTQSDETVRKRSDKLKGKPRSEDTKRKISESQQGKIISEETRLKMKETRQNNPMSDEQRKKLSEMYTGRVWTEDEKEKLKGKVVVVDRQGNLIKITVDEYNIQNDDDPEYVHFRTKEAAKRRNLNGIETSQG